MKEEIEIIEKYHKLIDRLQDIWATCETANWEYFDRNLYRLRRALVNEIRKIKN